MSEFFVYWNNDRHPSGFATGDLRQAKIQLIRLVRLRKRRDVDVRVRDVLSIDQNAYVGCYPQPHAGLYDFWVNVLLKEFERIPAFTEDQVRGLMSAAGLGGGPTWEAIILKDVPIVV